MTTNLNQQLAHVVGYRLLVQVLLQVVGISFLVQVVTFCWYMFLGTSCYSLSVHVDSDSG